jgi:hypothetical protein
MKRLNLVGQKFWRLSVVEDAWNSLCNGKRHSQFKCKCDCGNECIVAGYYLKSGHTQSCGCIVKENCGNNFRTHWMTDTRINDIRINMRARCNNIEDKDYWWRGITYDPKRESFEEFYKDMWPTYKDWLTIDRKDTNWNYYKSNCKRSSRLEQWKNKRNNIWIEYNWKRQILAEWARELWICAETIRYRIKRWRPIEKILDIKI